jgi:hypothetical protein
VELPDTDRSGWLFALDRGDREVGRITFVGPGVDPAGGWRWAIKFGEHGHERTYADALAALRRRLAAR